MSSLPEIGRQIEISWSSTSKFVHRCKVTDIKYVESHGWDLINGYTTDYLTNVSVEYDDGDADELEFYMEVHRRT